MNKELQEWKRIREMYEELLDFARRLRVVSNSISETQRQELRDIERELKALKLLDEI